MMLDGPINAACNFAVVQMFNILIVENCNWLSKWFIIIITVFLLHLLQQGPWVRYTVHWLK